MGRVVRHAVLAGLVAAVALSTPARAEPIVALGVGNGPPSAVTDAAGTLHAVWNIDLDATRDDALAYCRVPAGGNGCAPLVLGGFSWELLRPPKLLLRPQDGALIVIASGWDDDNEDVTFALLSRDGGTTWSPPAIVGRGLDAVSSAALTPDGTAVDVVGDGALGTLGEPQGAEFVWQRVPLTGGVETRLVGLRPEPDGRETDMDSSRTVGHLPDGRPMVVAYGTDLGARARVYRAGDPYQNTSWSPWRVGRRIPGTFVAAAFGPQGTWALTQDAATDETKRVWRWNGRRFVKPRSLRGGNRIGGMTGDTGFYGGFDFAEDEGGRLHAVWRDWAGLCSRDRYCLVYRRGGRRGFGRPVVYPLQPSSRTLLPNDISIAANVAGAGWIVWRAGCCSATGNYATPLVRPLPGSRPGARRVGRRRVRMPDHRRCVRPGGRFVHRLLTSGDRSRTRILSVRFYFDHDELSRTDRRAPYRATYRLSFAPGTRHVAGAEVTYRRRGRTARARVARMVVMCP